MNLITDLKEVFELAVNAKKFIEEVFNLCKEKNSGNNSQVVKSGDYSQVANSGYNAKVANSGYNVKVANSGDNSQVANSGNNSQVANSGDDVKVVNSGNNSQVVNSGNNSQVANSGDNSQVANSGDDAKVANSGYNVKVANSGNNSQVANSGDYSKVVNSGDYSQVANSGYNAKVANSGNNVKVANSGNNSQVANSGNYSQVANSGDYAQVANSGLKSVIASIGYCDIVKAMKGSWITLAEYRKNKEGLYEIYFVKTEFVDGEKIKEDTFYCLYEKEFREVIEVDGIKSAILNKKNNVYKIWNLSDDKTSYLIEKDGIYSHGETIKKAKESWIYKNSTRDTSQYENMDINTKLDFSEIVKMYRAITGACEGGCKYFVEQNNVKIKKYTIKEIIELTKGQYGNNEFKEFFIKGE